MTHLERDVGDFGSRLFESREKAVEFARRMNGRLDGMDPHERTVIGMLNFRYAECTACGEFGMGGTVMSCGLERLAVVADSKGRGWRVARERCMLRSWVEHLATGVDPSQSRLGAVNEYRGGGSC